MSKKVKNFEEQKKEMGKQYEEQIKKAEKIVSEFQKHIKEIPPSFAAGNAIARAEEAVMWAGNAFSEYYMSMIHNLKNVENFTEKAKDFKVEGKEDKSGNA